MEESYMYKKLTQYSKDFCYRKNLGFILWNLHVKKAS